MKNQASLWLLGFILVIAAIWLSQRPPSSSSQNRTTFSSARVDHETTPTAQEEKPSREPQQIKEPSSDRPSRSSIKDLPHDRVLPPLKKENKRTSRIANLRVKGHGLQKGPAFNMNRGSYQLVGARAVKAANYHSGMGEKVFEQNGFVVVATDPGLWQDMTYRSTDNPVVVSSSGRVGIVTGTIMVKLSNASRAQQFARRHNLELLSIDRDIHTAFFKPAENVSILRTVESLRLDGSAENVELEIVSGRKEPK